MSDEKASAARADMVSDDFDRNLTKLREWVASTPEDHDPDTEVLRWAVGELERLALRETKCVVCGQPALIDDDRPFDAECLTCECNNLRARLATVEAERDEARRRWAIEEAARWHSGPSWIATSRWGQEEAERLFPRTK